MRRAADYFHPAVGLVYFVAVITCVMLFMSPLYIIPGLLLAIVSGVIYCGIKRVRKALLTTLPFCLLIAVFNPLVSQGGVTPLLIIGGRAFTLEALLFGLCSGGMLLLMILWFLSYNRVLPPERFQYLFSKISPAAAMLVTMTQRMIGLFGRRFHSITAAQKTLLCDTSHGNALTRVKNGIRVSSILLSWSMEEGLDTADSMKARGYGVTRRSSYAVYHFRVTDVTAIIIIVVLLSVCFAGYYTSPAMRFYPAIVLPAPGICGIASLTAYLFLGLLPVFAEITEGIKWR